MVKNATAGKMLRLPERRLIGVGGSAESPVSRAIFRNICEPLERQWRDAKVANFDRLLEMRDRLSEFRAGSLPYPVVLRERMDRANYVKIKRSGQTVGDLLGVNQLLLGLFHLWGQRLSCNGAIRGAMLSAPALVAQVTGEIAERNLTGQYAVVASMSVAKARSLAGVILHSGVSRVVVGNRLLLWEQCPWLAEGGAHGGGDRGKSDGIVEIVLGSIAFSSDGFAEEDLAGILLQAALLQTQCGFKSVAFRPITRTTAGLVAGESGYSLSLMVEDEDVRQSRLTVVAESWLETLLAGDSGGSTSSSISYERPSSTVTVRDDPHLHLTIGGFSLSQVLGMDLQQATAFLEQVGEMLADGSYGAESLQVAVRPEMQSRLFVCVSEAIANTVHILEMLQSFGMGDVLQSAPLLELSAPRFQILQLCRMYRELESDVVLFIENPFAGFEPEASAYGIGVMKVLVERGVTVVYTTLDPVLLSAADDLFQVDRAGNVYRDKASPSCQSSDSEEEVQLSESDGWRARSTGLATWLLAMAEENRTRFTACVEQAKQHGGKGMMIVDLRSRPFVRDGKASLASYLGISSVLCQLFARTPQVRMSGMKVSLLMSYARDTTVRGRERLVKSRGIGRVRELQSLIFKGLSFDQWYGLTFEELGVRLARVPKIASVCGDLVQLGLGHLVLSHAVSSLSIREWQKANMLLRRSGRSAGSVFLLIDEGFFRDREIQEREGFSQYFVKLQERGVFLLMED